MILDHIRTALDRVSKLIDLLREADERREHARSDETYGEGRIRELGSDDDTESVHDSKPRIPVEESGTDGKGLDDQEMGARSLSRYSSVYTRPLRARSLVEPFQHAAEPTALKEPSLYQSFGRMTPEATSTTAPTSEVLAGQSKRKDSVR